jgi:hypothetical protein
MTTLTWLASRAFNHFLLSNVINDAFHITRRSQLVQAIGLCFKIGSTKISSTAFTGLPTIASWITSFRNLNAEFELVDKVGMTQTIQFGINQYATAVDNYLTYGLRDLYVRTLKALSVPDAEDVALRVLSRSVKPRSGTTFAFVLTEADTYRSRSTKRDEARETTIALATESEHELMDIMETYNDAFRFLDTLGRRLAADDATRQAQHKDARPARKFPLAPLTSMKPCFIRLDKTALSQLWRANRPRDNGNVLPEPECIEEVLRVRARPNLHIGNSFQTDGTQLTVPYIATTTTTILVLPARHKETLAAEELRIRKLATYRAQQDLLTAGGAVDPKDRITWYAAKPRYPVDKSVGVPLNWSFVGADNGFFGRLSAHASNAGPNSELPAIIAIDPGQKNIWCASAVHPTAVDKRAEAKPVLNLTRRKYNQGIGLLAFRHWLDTAKKNMTEHDFVAAQDALSEHTLKGVGLAAFEANFVVQRRSFEVLKHLYGSRSFGKRRFVRQQRRQKFDATFTNSAAARFRAAAGKDDFVGGVRGRFVPAHHQGNGRRRVCSQTTDDTSIQEGTCRPCLCVLSCSSRPRYPTWPTSSHRCRFAFSVSSHPLRNVPSFSPRPFHVSLPGAHCPYERIPHNQGVP